MDHQTEIQRAEAAIKGNAEAMSSLFQLYRPRLYVYALGIMGNTPAAQDVMQDTFISAFTHIASLHNSSLFYPWLKKILINNCYRALQKEKSRGKKLASIPDSFIENSIEQNIEKTSNTHQVFSVLNTLSPELRACVLLRYFSSFSSYDDIATVLGIPVGTVRSRLAAARQKLYNDYSLYNDAHDHAFTEARQWTKYYLELWKCFYEDNKVRNEFFNSLNPSLHVRFTSGKSATGKYLLEEEFNNDFIYGSRFCVEDVHSCGNISIVEGYNINSSEYPERCAPSSIIILFREKGNSIHACNVFDSPRPL